MDAAVPGAVLCVYYKVDAAQHVALAPRVRQFQAELCRRWPGLCCELLQRPEVSDGCETWMETYRDAQGLTPHQVATIDQAAQQAGLPAARHTEHFVPLR